MASSFCPEHISTEAKKRRKVGTGQEGQARTPAKFGALALPAMLQAYETSVVRPAYPMASRVPKRARQVRWYLCPSLRPSLVTLSSWNTFHCASGR